MRTCTHAFTTGINFTYMYKINIPIEARQKKMAFEKFENLV